MSFKAFMSYSRADGEIAIQLANDLTKEGVDIWIDQLPILPAAERDQATQNALLNAKCILFLASEHSIHSQNVMDEVNYAIDNGKK